MLKFFHKYFTFFIFTYFIIAFIIFKDDYFFGDAITSTSRAATNIYEHGIYFYPAGFDPGHPPTYAILLSYCWIIFGKSLFVSHAYGIAWCIFLFLGFRKVCSLFLDHEHTNYASILALAHPTFISQNAMMLNTAMLMGCFLWAFYFLFSKQKLKLIFMLCLMMASHLQGAFFLASIAVADFVVSRKELSIFNFLKAKFLTYSIPFILFMIWLIIHYQHSGWWLISPDFTDTHESNSILQVVKGLVYCAWRFVDYGMIIPFIIYFYLKFKNKNIFNYDSFLWITLIVSSIIMSLVLKNTIAHRYFLGFELLLLIVVVKEITLLNSGIYLFYIAIVTALILGNFIYYPGKTIADANIRYRDFFGSFKSFLTERGNGAEYYSKAPIANPAKLMDLRSQEDFIKRIGKPLDSLSMVVTSNVCAEFTKEENEILSGWYGKSFENGAVYINLYLNPKYHGKPEPHYEFNLREPGTFEKWMIKMKNIFK